MADNKSCSTFLECISLSIRKHFFGKIVSGKSEGDHTDVFREDLSATRKRD
jgi:hypothetical protein